MIHRALACSWVLALGACGDDAGTPSDTAADATSDAPDTTSDAAADGDAGPDPTFDPIGTVSAELYLDPSNPGNDSTLFDVSVRDRAYARVHVPQGHAGACARYDRATAPCTPECGAEEACQADNTCVPFPTAASVGVVTWSAPGARTITQTPDTSTPDYLYYPSVSEPGRWFASGDPVRVVAAGGELPGFDVTLTGVAPLEAPPGAADFPYNDRYDADLDVVWTPATAGSTIEVSLRVGWHGAPPESMIICRAPDEAGHVVIAKALLAGFGFCTGPCLFQHPSEIQRLSRALVTTASGPVEVVVKTRGPLRIAAPR